LIGISLLAINLILLSLASLLFTTCLGGNVKIICGAWGRSITSLGCSTDLIILENMGADIWDLTAYPVQKIKGFVEDFVWQPGEKIFVLMKVMSNWSSLTSRSCRVRVRWAMLTETMEKMAGAPGEAMGFRSPGEKTKYEVQRLENASARIFQNKINQFEEQIIEPIAERYA
jgi:hypothetical protein